MCQCTTDAGHVLTGEVKVPVCAHMNRITLHFMCQCMTDAGHMQAGEEQYLHVQT